MPPNRSGTGVTTLTQCYRLYVYCIWPWAYEKVLYEADENDLPPDVADDVKYYTEINIKIVYALNQGIHFGDQDIPEE